MIAANNDPVDPAGAASFRRCMQRELSAIFDDDNPVDDVLFILGTPESMLSIVAYCTWEAAFGIAATTTTLDPLLNPIVL